MSRWSSRLFAIALGLCALPAQAEEARPELALMGTIPIYWGEAAGLEELISGDAPAHWARSQLEQHFSLAPLDYLSPAALAQHRYLLLAQPRGLSAEENVALDAWVRDGGRLLLFADPMMTGESRFHIGDRRRPQDMALLSPILARWGLEMVFDAQQAAGPQVVDHFGDPLPVNMHGELRLTDAGGSCAIPGAGLLAHCVIGQGQAMVIADAAMLDLHGPPAQAAEALDWLVSHVFEQFGDNAGEHGVLPAQTAESPASPDRARHVGEHYHHQAGNFGVSKNR